MEKTIGIVYAPIEIENPGQLETLGITWKDVVPLKVGKRTVSVYLVPASEEVSRYMLRELRNKYQAEFRSTRCRVPGDRGTKVCRTRSSCEDCAYYPVRQPQESSLEMMFEDGFVAVVLAAQHFTKRIPVSKVVEIGSILHKPIMLLGGKDAKKAARLLKSELIPSSSYFCQ